jgi:glycosyltransferase involved in cell wall biosynthesis
MHAAAMFQRGVDIGEQQSFDPKPLVSVIIPCFNHSQFLDQAIESALNQTWQPLEVIVVDDGSTDDTPAVIASYPVVKSLRQENQGLSAARNTGWRASRGRYVLFLDSDDFLSPTALEMGVREITTHPEYAFVTGDYRQVNHEGNLLGESNFPRDVSEPYLTLLRKNYIMNPAMVLYRREVLESFGGFDPKLRATQDYDLYLKIARQFPIGHFRGLMVLYRRYENSMTSNAELMMIEIIEVMTRQQAHLGDDPRRHAAYREGLRDFCGNSCRAFLIQSLKRLTRPGYRRKGIEGIKFFLSNPIWLWRAFWNKYFLLNLVEMLPPFASQWLIAQRSKRLQRALRGQ